MNTYGRNKRVTKFPERHDPMLGPLVAVLGRIADGAWMRTLCAACGCLVLPDEVCPGCRSNRLLAERDHDLVEAV